MSEEEKDSFNLTIATCTNSSFITTLSGGLNKIADILNCRFIDNETRSITDECLTFHQSTCIVLTSTNNAIKLTCDNNSSQNLLCRRSEWIRTPNPDFPSYQMLWFYLSLVILIFICSLLFNIIIVVGIFKSKILKKSKSVVSALHMAFIDLLIGLIVIPLYFIIVLAQNLYEFHAIMLISEDTYFTLNKWFGILHFVFFVSSFMNIAVISIERCLSVTKPFFYLHHASVKKTAFTIPVIWFYSGATILLYLNILKTVMFLFISMFVVPTVIMVISYTILVVSLRNPKPKLTSQINKHKNSVGSMSSNRKMETQVMFKLLVLVIAFMLCWLPYFMIALRPLEQTNVANKSLIRYIILLTHLHSTFDAILYAMAKPIFRNELKRSFKSSGKCSRPVKFQLEIRPRTCTGSTTTYT